ncbi:adipolin-like isoform X2 [Clytia hemisphaerica]|uniref:C1q domain containing protein n=1 Tax=Clytia hemisphaerica TaxID=252671 RepID=A0A7M5V1A5_9CNID
MKQNTMRITMMLYFFLGCIECNKYLELDKKTQSQVMKLGQQIFGQHSNRKTTGVAVPQQPRERPPKKKLDPKETWAVWQKSLRQKELLTQRKEKNTQRKKRRPRPTKEPLPPASVMSLKDMVSQFRRVLRTQKSFGLKPSQRVVNNVSEMMAAGIPDILSGFAISTHVNIPLRHRSTIELDKYETNKQGAFLRGSGVSLKSGRFTAPTTAVYSFHGTVHISLPKGMKEFARKDFVTASICIDAQCKKHMSISSTSGLRSNSRIFSLNVSGYMYLEANRFVSVFIHNQSQRYNINIIRGSYFSGMLVGT